MKFRSLLAVALAGAMVLAAAGCSDDEDSASDTTTTTVRESDSKKDSDPPADDSSSDDPSTDDSSSDDADTPVSSDSDTEVPDFGQLGDCMSAGLAYAGLAMSALGGPEGAKAAREAADAMKSTIPKDLHDELDVVTKAFATVAEKGIVAGGEAMDSKEFEKADEKLSAYFDEVCDTGSTSE